MRDGTRDEATGELVHDSLPVIHAGGMDLAKAALLHGRNDRQFGLISDLNKTTARCLRV